MIFIIVLSLAAISAAHVDKVPPNTHTIQDLADALVRLQMKRAYTGPHSRFINQVHPNQAKDTLLTIRGIEKLYLKSEQLKPNTYKFRDYYMGFLNYFWRSLECVRHMVIERQREYKSLDLQLAHLRKLTAALCGKEFKSESSPLNQPIKNSESKKEVPCKTVEPPKSKTENETKQENKSEKKMDKKPASKPNKLEIFEVPKNNTAQKKK